MHAGKTESVLDGSMVNTVGSVHGGNGSCQRLHWPDIMHIGLLSEVVRSGVMNVTAESGSLWRRCQCWLREIGELGILVIISISISIIVVVVMMSMVMVMMVVVMVVVRMIVAERLGNLNRRWRCLSTR